MLHNKSFSFSWCGSSLETGGDQLLLYSDFFTARTKNGEPHRKRLRFYSTKLQSYLDNLHTKIGHKVCENYTLCMLSRFTQDFNRDFSQDIWQFLDKLGEFWTALIQLNTKFHEKKKSLSNSHVFHWSNQAYWKVYKSSSVSLLYRLESKWFLLGSGGNFDLKLNSHYSWSKRTSCESLPSIWLMDMGQIQCSWKKKGREKTIDHSS